jgi:hypothetical protein
MTRGFIGAMGFWLKYFKVDPSPIWLSATINLSGLLLRGKRLRASS